MSNFDEIEAMLSQLLVASTPTLSDARRAQVQEFIDVGEYGLALETVVYGYSETKKIATAEVVGLVERLIAAMSMDAALLVELPK
jgi:hypothetical protein